MVSTLRGYRLASRLATASPDDYVAVFEKDKRCILVAWKDAVRFPMLRQSFVLLGLILATSLAASSAAASSLRAERLHCEGLLEPQGIDTARPRLSWELGAVQPDTFALKQSAYQILVASSLQKLAADQGDLWDSGKIVSDETIHVPYAGTALGSRQVCHWKVRVWDQDAVCSD